MKFDSTQLLNGLDKMRADVAKEGRSLAIEQGDFFARMARKIGWSIAPSKEKLDAVAVSLGSRMKRRVMKNGRRASFAQELNFRKRARGMFAKGWFVAKVETAGSTIRIWIVNLVDYAGTVNEGKHVAERAADVVGQSFNRKLKKSAQSVCDGFNGKAKSSAIYDQTKVVQTANTPVSRS